VVQTFQLEQYRCEGEPEIVVREGDVVIDGGACFGDTALYFAHLAGPAGRVIAFEFEPGNLALLDYNLALNPGLAQRIQVRRRALWDRPGERVGFRAFGPATAITEGTEAQVETVSVDALVERSELERVDFLKLDVEGAELPAMRGAESTLRRFRPRLALAGYHRDDDLAALSSFLFDLDCGYRLRLAHTTMHAEETMLFAIAG
jgi:FkbM family methyltransferase